MCFSCRVCKPPADHSECLLRMVGGRFSVCGGELNDAVAPYSLLAALELAAGLLSDAELLDESDLLSLEALLLSEPSLPAPVAGVAEELPRWSVL